MCVVRIKNADFAFEKMTVDDKIPAKRKMNPE